MTTQIFQIIRAPEEPLLLAGELKSLIWRKRTKSEWEVREVTTASQPINPVSSIRKKIAECLTKVEAHVKNRNYGMAMKMEGAAIVLQEVLDEIESTSQSNTLVDGDKLCDFCGLCDFQKQKRKKNSG